MSNPIPDPHPLQSLVPHEIKCRCGQGGVFGYDLHAEDCPRREVGEMLSAAPSARPTSIVAEIRAELATRAAAAARVIGMASPESEERARHEEQALRAAIDFIDLRLSAPQEEGEGRQIRVCVNCWTVIRPENDGAACECERKGWTRLWVDFDPAGSGGGKEAERSIVISYCGGPLEGVGGLAASTEPLELDTGTYRFDGAYEDTGAIMQWEPRKGGDDA